MEEIQEAKRGLPVLGREAPDFEAETTVGKIRLSDYRGKWVVLFSHPADFTPVCTSEFIGFAEKYQEFKKRNVELIGLSIDSVSSHIAWTRNIKEKFGVDIPFPVIADLGMQVAGLYGMIQEGESSTVTVRTVFLIDPEGILKAMIYYPLTNGRSMNEILRLVDSLQTTYEHKVATPANWEPGDAVVVPPPATAKAAEERLKEGYECVDWYFCKKKL